MAEPTTRGIPRRRPERLPRGSWMRRLADAGLLLAGVAIAALAFNHFLVPHHVACGGVVGMSLVLNRALGLDTAVIQVAANLAILGLGLGVLGRGAALRALAGSLLMPLAVALAGRTPWCDDPLLAALAGGAGIGIGVGLSLRSGWTVGGFSLFARLLDRRFGLGVARVLALLDGAVVVAAGLVIGSPQAAILALVAVFTTTRAVDVVNAGLARAKTVMIVSRRSAEVREAVLHELDLGATVLPAQGGFTGQPMEVLLVVVPPGDLWRLKQRVGELDPEAFTVVSDAHEVLGHGFHSPG